MQRYAVACLTKPDLMVPKLFAVWRGGSPSDLEDLAAVTQHWNASKDVTVRSLIWQLTAEFAPRFELINCAGQASKGAKHHTRKWATLRFPRVPSWICSAGHSAIFRWQGKEPLPASFSTLVQFVTILRNHFLLQAVAISLLLIHVSRLDILISAWSASAPAKHPWHYSEEVLEYTLCICRQR